MGSSAFNYEPILKESIHRYLNQIQAKTSDFSCFASIFSRLVQTNPDPPLEIVYFYSAVNYRDSNLMSDEPLKRLFTVKDLFQLLVCCSESSSALQKIAVLGPLVYELVQLLLDCNVKNVCLKREILCLVEGFISYISLCCCEGFKEEDGLVGLSCDFVDLIKVWTANLFEGIDCLRKFFPLVGDEVRSQFIGEVSVGYLAAVVMTEVFLLRLCLRFGLGNLGMELQKDMQSWTIEVLQGFKSLYFYGGSNLLTYVHCKLQFPSPWLLGQGLGLRHSAIIDILFRTLLEPVLPVTNLLDCKDEVQLLKILYQAVVVEFPLLISKRGTLLPGSGNHVKKLAIMWLYVVDDAIQYSWKNGDKTGAFYYLNAFLDSPLTSQIIKWFTDESVCKGQASPPDISTPSSLIIAYILKTGQISFALVVCSLVQVLAEWLLILENEGVRIIDQCISKLRHRAVAYKSRSDHEISVLSFTSMQPDGNILCCHENGGGGEDRADGDHEMVDSLELETLASAPTYTISLKEIDGGKKRKDMGNDDGETRVKFVKYYIQENSLNEKHSPFGSDDYSSSGGEVENPVSDEDISAMEH
ncbi:hypothetical protein RJ641_005887 [Dillenia turbinata]|uniref:Uncharacterized protein n=1 Tax=Dillenia turbinata TaxID=194707 RepID=A0AAN8VBY8_9MAGN